MNKHGKIDSKVKEEIIKKYLETPRGRTNLAAAMAAPLRRSMNYSSIARSAFAVDRLPDIKCPECGCKHTVDRHPDNDCSLGHVYNVMEV